MHKLLFYDEGRFVIILGFLYDNVFLQKQDLNVLGA